MMKAKVIFGVLFLAISVFACSPASACDSLKSMQAKDACITGIALGKNKINICDAAPSQRDCYSAFWKEMQDIKICEKLQPDMKYACLDDYDEITGKNACSNVLDLKERESCFSGMGLQKKAASGCSGIEDLKYKDKCLSRAAGDQNDASVCGMISGQSYKDECHYKIGALNLDIAKCDQIINDTLKGKCYIFLASRKQDSGICGNAPHASKELCTFGVALSSNDLEACNKLPDLKDNTMKDACYTGIALRTSSPEICGMEKSTFERDSCYMSIAAKIKDPQLCGKITNGGKASSCRDSIARDIQ